MADAKTYQYRVMLRLDRPPADLAQIGAEALLADLGIFDGKTPDEAAQAAVDYEMLKPTGSLLPSDGGRLVVCTDRGWHERDVEIRQEPVVTVTAAQGGEVVE